MSGIEGLARQYVSVGNCEMVHFINKVDLIEYVDKHLLLMVFRRLRGSDPNADVARGGSRGSHDDDPDSWKSGHHAIVDLTLTSPLRNHNTA
jgi:hypothetical protein